MTTVSFSFTILFILSKDSFGRLLLPVFLFIQYILPLLFAGFGFYLMITLLPAEGQYLLILPDTEYPIDTLPTCVSRNEQRTIAIALD